MYPPVVTSFFLFFSIIYTSSLPLSLSPFLYSYLFLYLSNAHMGKTFL